ncbi:uncharacterized protein BDZ99DRAFT_516339 [Mytilinidion resinicola]|uniref:TOM core complex subunit Tom6 n=1 Tax=Mytilinidion resinicola TaxID=574789 RepID=A0A6A6YXK2_9PEZI|nr:uncharacterized protein BDZ99DRAFT_516339 [Mytilinidion resinicola]KAF2813686.1 hypothetical protein BDZ99DRAFT_516339 [Mytilinidion resinicola]
MPPKQVRGGNVQVAQPNYAQSIYRTVTSSENRGVITAAGLFVAGVAFLHSSLSEFIVPA